MTEIYSPLSRPGLLRRGTMTSAQRQQVEVLARVRMETGTDLALRNGSPLRQASKHLERLAGMAVTPPAQIEKAV